MPKESEFTQGVNPLCQNDELWTARDEQSSEDEVNKFLCALVMLIKPQFVVETGCYLGDGTIAIAAALKNNGVGKMITCDVDLVKVSFVQERIKEQGLEDIAEVVLMEGEKLIKECGSIIDFAFIDSSPEGKVRGAEIKELLKHLRPGKMFALHDTAPQHEEINAVANSVGLPNVYFNCPRGLTLYEKR